MAWTSVCRQVAYRHRGRGRDAVVADDRPDSRCEGWTVTLALAIVFLAVLMIYCGVAGKSLKSALTGRSVLGSSGQIAGA